MPRKPVNSNTFRVPGVHSYGTWRTLTFEHRGNEQHGAVLEPSEAPWRGLFAALDAAEIRDDGAPVDVRDEAAAIVACCWRYGTYLHVLTQGEPYPEFHADPQLSRLGDWEMQRINLEFSSGLAQWLIDRRERPEQVRRRVWAAQQLLPGVPKPSITPAALSFYTDACAQRLDRLTWVVQELARRRGPELAENAAPDAPHLQARHEANFIVHNHYRSSQSDQDSPIETFHSGNWSLGTEVPGFRRFSEAELTQIMRPLVRELTVHLATPALQPFPDTRPMPGFAAAPRDWSVTLDTAPVKYYGLPGYGPLESRINALSPSMPSV